MIRIALALLVTLIATGVAEAAATLPAPTASPVPIVAIERAPRLNSLKKTASAEIDRRLYVIETARSHLDESVTMSASLHTELAAALKAESDKLSGLKSQLSAESDLAAARTQVQAVLDEYRVYGLLVPRANLASAADRLQGTATVASGSLAKVKTKLAGLDAAGRNTRDLHRSYEQALARMSSVNAAVTAELAALALPPEADYVKAHQTLVATRNTLQSARDDLAAARANLEAIIAAINALS